MGALLVLIVTEAAPAKGGSKSMMKNRGGSKGSGSRGRGVSNHPSGEDGDSGVGGSGIRTDKPPCVGLCYYTKATLHWPLLPQQAASLERVVWHQVEERMRELFWKIQLISISATNYYQLYLL